jgi:hypothetical protein
LDTAFRYKLEKREKVNTHGVIESLFSVKRVLIGVIHLQALPGTPANKLDVADITSIAVDEARVYKDAGLHGIVIENTHDRPYLKGLSFIIPNAESVRQFQPRVALWQPWGTRM